MRPTLLTSLALASTLGLTSAAARAPTRDPELIARAHRAYRAQRFREAARGYDRALAASPDDPLLLRQFGLSLARLGHRSRAAQLLRRALKLRPRDRHALLGYGDLLRAQAPEKAAALYARALRVSPGWAPAESRLARARAAAGGANKGAPPGTRPASGARPPSPPRLIRAAIEAAAAAELAFTVPDALAQVFAKLADAGEAPAARAAIRLGLQRAASLPDHSQTLAVLVAAARTLGDLGDPDAAREVLARAEERVGVVPVVPRRFHGWLDLADAFRSLEAPAEVRRCVARAASMVAEEDLGPPDRVRLGVALAELGDELRARVIADELLEGPERDQVRAALVREIWRRGHAERARALAAEVVDPRARQEAWLGIARALVDQGQDDEALAAAARLDDPQFRVQPAAWIRDRALARGEVEAALAQVSPDASPEEWVQVYAGVARAHQRRGDLEAARAALEDQRATLDAEPHRHPLEAHLANLRALAEASGADTLGPHFARVRSWVEALPADQPGCIARHQLAHLALDLGWPPDAESLLDRAAQALAGQPAEPACGLDRAGLAARLGRWDDALAALDAAGHPRFRGAAAGPVIRALAEAGEWPRAVSLVRSLPAGDLRALALTDLARVALARRENPGSVSRPGGDAASGR